MRMGPVAATPDAWVAGLDGWRRERVETLRAAVRAVDGTDEVIKWGHLVYLSNGPVALIRAEGRRVLLGFWRGQRLRDLEPRLKPGGQYEMASLSLVEGDVIDPEIVTALTRAALDLNADLGDSTKAPKKE
ncbi:MAG: DUF1801 domain-containing protein [Brevundimonas sp.]|uniref:DUF1801 domain-containing protein n=2 Tax=Brevundimonas sp. TaxID=1871086 RepID=UPI00261ADD39|nr:DUF1801 domain-containing protein [Brevundimonas sp.]MDI6624365.1 DUF1801 domain-containing protein [Brevundimonas sp.]